MIYRQTLYIFFFLLSRTNNVLAKSSSVIIIGAGPAGIAAATKLLENSITDIKIVEAENRIGGRIHSVKFGNGYVDLGGEYCDGREGNIAYELVKDLDLLEPYTGEFSQVYLSDGSTTDSELKEELLVAVYRSYVENITNTENVTLGDAVLSKYNKTVLSRYENNKQKLKLATDGIKLIENVIILDEGIFSWHQLPAKVHFIECEGGFMTWKTRGYHIILDILMKGYPNPDEKLPIDDKIVLNTKVEKIIWNNDKIEVKCANNTSLKADHVIFTPSVGVLKAEKDALFEPDLPQNKINALEAIGINAIMKIIIYFPQKWWNQNDSVFFFLWSKEDLPNIKNEFPDGPSKNGISWLASIPMLSKVPHNPNVFSLWAVGDLIPEIEKSSEDVLLRGCNYLIKKFLGKNYNITNADRIIRSQWAINSNFLGTYSHEKVEYFRSDIFPQSILAEPLLNSKGHPAVLFAGEATHPTQYGTVHGAIKTGIREAERIIQLHNDK
ncbi:spermine oxidase-like [Zophobas morio]|uniref:spermine oxidase-like n=1 Tax=Zophobas morio TaxID=2755281 RepID=UPI003083EB68